MPQGGDLASSEEEWVMKYAALRIICITCAILLVGCAYVGTRKNNLSSLSTEELIRLLEDTKDNGLFPDVIRELEMRGPTAYDAAPALARAMTYNRRDSTIASRPLIAMGSLAKSAIPILLEVISKTH